jgi:hypothetical protein
MASFMLQPLPLSGPHSWFGWSYKEKKPYFTPARNLTLEIKPVAYSVSTLKYLGFHL